MVLSVATPDGKDLRVRIAAQSTGPPPRRGFTLIELLVVVAIIAVLISILLPSLGKAREVSKAAVCLSNLRSLMQAVHVYANDHDGRLITAGLAHGGSVDEHAAWMNTLRNEYGNELIARCPNDDSRYWDEPWPGSDPPQYRRASYATNYHTVTEVWPGHGPFDRLTMFRSPAETILFVELVAEDETGYAVSDHVHPENWFFDPRKEAAKQVHFDRHLNKANYGFMDGHAGRHAFAETYEIDWESSKFPEYLWFMRNLYDPEIAPGGKQLRKAAGH